MEPPWNAERPPLDKRSVKAILCSFFYFFTGAVQQVKKGRGRLDRKKNPVLRTLLFSLWGMFLLILLIVYPKEISESLRRGVETCLWVLVPSLFPFLVVTSFLVNIGAGESLTRMATHRDGNGVWFLFFISLTGGYPVAARTFSTLAQRGQLEKEQAAHFICCATGAGPAFVLTAVGTGMFQSPTLGFLLLAAQWSTSFLLLALWRAKRKPSLPFSSVQSMRPGEALTEAVASSSRSMLLICAWVLVFSGLSVLLREMGIALFLEKAFPFLPEGSGNAVLSGLLEVTNGCKAAAEWKGTFALVLCGFFMGFGGCCIALQVQTFSHQVGLSLGRFLCWRLFQGTLAALSTFFLLKIFPNVSPVFLSNVQPIPQGTAAPATGSALLVILCLCFLGFPRNSGEKTG